MGSGNAVIHYHGTPITPGSVLAQLAGRCFCVSYAAPENIAVCHEIGQSNMLDNGAYTIWQMVQENKPIPARLVEASRGNWKGYYEWVEPWLEYPTTWAVIPDVIDGDEAANDRLVAEWPFGGRGAPVWHLHEPIERLLRLADEWAVICLGSSAQYAVVGAPSWHRRMERAMNALCGSGPVPVWLHMLRGMSLSGSEYPFASVDSTDVARNHNRPQNTPGQMAARWDSIQNPARWVYREQLELVA